uniref:Integrin alpha-2 domain-containing protein n=1 Tax=Denticeps clupeoides TaxID=299321 RepID=A0AAY4CJJ5_9TELE
MGPRHTVRRAASLRSPALGWTCWALLALCVPGSAFNLDTSAPLIKEGEKGSFFGFSLALHQQLTPEARSWILVGAPRARGLGFMSNTHPGALYRCPISPEEYDCTRVDIDGEVNLERENKDNQWLGVTVKSQGIGGKVVVSLHRTLFAPARKQPSETRDPIGRCYVLSEDLTERDDLDGGEWKFCEGRPQGHEHFGFCQQGLSASFTADKNLSCLGHQEPTTGKMRVQLLNLTVLDLGYYDNGPYEVADEKMLDSDLIPVPYHSYLGFSVDSATGLMSRAELTFVAGAPRANHTGAVVLLRKDNVYRLVPQHILWGEELASSFGYSVATTDLNSDGWTDLVVGAPNFFDRKAEIGGAVYVFLNPAGHWDEARPLRLNGTYDSMFGMTVNSVGDLDQDGFGDIAVGAPFDGDGKVFIYRGLSSGLDTKPSQVLDGAAVGVKRFGYSISGGLDVDGNRYPDLAVGSLSDQVVLYRSCPVIHVIRDVTIDAGAKTVSILFCVFVSVEVKVCYAYTAHPDTYSPRITLSVLFEADTERRQLGLPHRVSFLGRTPYEPEYVRNVEVRLHGQKHPACQNVIFQLQENIRDKLRPISLAVTHTIKHPHHHRNTLRPVLSISMPSTLLSEVSIFTDPACCDSFLYVRVCVCVCIQCRDDDGMPVFSLSDQRSVVLEVTVTNVPSNPMEPQEDGDDAHAAQLLVTLPDTLSYSGFRGQQVVCQANQNGSMAECDLGNPLKRDARLKFYIILSTSSITIETTSLSVEFVMSTISEQPDLAPTMALAKVVIVLPLSVSGLARPHQLFFSGAVMGESAMSSLEEVGSPVEFEFTVTNTGQALATLGSAFLNIMWPHELGNGKWLLYPTGLQSEDLSLSHCMPTSFLNPLKIGSNDQPQSANLKVTFQLDTFHCVHRVLCCSSAHCLLFQCPLQSVSGTAVLKIKARLWNSTFIEVLFQSDSISMLSSIKHLVLRDIPVMIYPEHGLSDQYVIPWWIILVAVLAGILVLALLVCILWKCGFFRRTERAPQYETEYYRAHLHLQPSEAEKQAAELQ